MTDIARWILISSKSYERRFERPMHLFPNDNRAKRQRLRERISESDIAKRNISVFRSKCRPSISGPTFSACINANATTCINQRINTNRREYSSRQAINFGCCVRIIRINHINSFRETSLLFTFLFTTRLIYRAGRACALYFSSRRGLPRRLSHFPKRDEARSPRHTERRDEARLESANNGALGIRLGGFISARDPDARGASRAAS